MLKARPTSYVSKAMDMVMGHGERGQKKVLPQSEILIIGGQGHKPSVHDPHLEAYLSVLPRKGILCVFVI